MIMADTRRTPRNATCPGAVRPVLASRVRMLPQIAVGTLAALAACGGGGGGSTGGAGTTTQAQLQRVEFGRLVDVYGLEVTPQGAIPSLYRKDVVIGGNIQDQRPANSNLRDDEITYDFLGTNPDSLQPRLFIPRDANSPE